MNPSIELINIMLHFYEIQAASDVNSFKHLLSQQDGVLMIGTDPSEWWAGYDTILDQLLKTQPQELSKEAPGNIQIRAGEVSAFVEGTVGWVADTPSMRLPNGKEIPTRVTTIFHREEGEWKIVQFHASIGVPNAEVLGSE